MGILFKCFGGSSSSTSRKQPSSATVEDLCYRFPLYQLRKSTDGFHKTRLIAETIYSQEYRGSISVNGELKHVTAKRLRREAAISSYSRMSYRNNIIFRSQLHHQNLASLVGFCDDHNEMIVIYEYAPNGSLYHQLYERESNSPTLSWKRRLEISIGVARGLHYLHSGTKRTIIHRDIKPPSILLDQNWVPKLNITGFSVKGPKFSEKEAKPVEMETIEGTIGYMAPEYFMNAQVTHKCDVYSFGAVLLELICGKPPHHIIGQFGHPQNLGFKLGFVQNESHIYFRIRKSYSQKIIQSNPISLHDVYGIEGLRNLGGRGNGEGVIDESLEGEIAPQCLELFMEITESCLSLAPTERPDMGEVEVQLEHVLQLQEEADASHTCLI